MQQSGSDVVWLALPNEGCSTLRVIIHRGQYSGRGGFISKPANFGNRQNSDFAGTALVLHIPPILNRNTVQRFFMSLSDECLHCGGVTTSVFCCHTILHRPIGILNAIHCCRHLQVGLSQNLKLLCTLLYKFCHLVAFGVQSELEYSSHSTKGFCFNKKRFIVDYGPQALVST